MEYTICLPAYVVEVARFLNCISRPYLGYLNQIGNRIDASHFHTLCSCLIQQYSVLMIFVCLDRYCLSLYKIQPLQMRSQTRWNLIFCHTLLITLSSIKFEIPPAHANANLQHKDPSLMQSFVTGTKCAMPVLPRQLRASEQHLSKPNGRAFGLQRLRRWSSVRRSCQWRASHWSRNQKLY
jgi:hypothetical protein